jgi:hypothetical protein
MIHYRTIQVLAPDLGSDPAQISIFIVRSQLRISSHEPKT